MMRLKHPRRYRNAIRPVGVEKAYPARELVGAVALAKGHIFGTPGSGRFECNDVKDRKCNIGQSGFR
jgi:hypothetical protein